MDKPVTFIVGFVKKGTGRQNNLFTPEKKIKRIRERLISWGIIDFVHSENIV